MSYDRPVSRERLMALLWSDRSETQAGNSLRQALSQLRKSLGDTEIEHVISAGEGLHLNTEAVWLDAREFEQAGDGREERLLSVAHLYRGDFLADFSVRDDAFEDWRRQEAARLRSLALDRLDALLVSVAAKADDETARDLGYQLLSIEPAHEGAHRALMKVHAARGMRGQALQQYEICREYLHRELGVQPDRETEELRRMVLAGKPAGRHRDPDESENTMAVLPFQVLDDDADMQSLACGLAASISMELGRFKSLSIVSAASSLKFKDTVAGHQDIAESLGVRYLVDGSINKSGEGLLGFVRLIESRSGRQLWSDRFDAEASNVLEVIDELVQSIVAPLASRIETEEIAVARRKPAANLETYDHWLHGLDCLRFGIPEKDIAAQEHFRAAIQCDPSFARAHAGLAMSYFSQWTCSALGSWDADIERCMKTANRALALDPADHWPHKVLAASLLFRREFDKSKAHFERAVALNPNDADLLAHGSVFLMYYGEHEAAVETALKAVRLNPFYNDLYPRILSWVFLAARQFDEAIEALNEIAEPHFPDLYWEVALHVELGDLARARALAATFRDGVGGYWQDVTSSNDLYEILQKINPWKRDEDNRRFFDALEQAGLFDDQIADGGVAQLSAAQ